MRLPILYALLLVISSFVTLALSQFCLNEVMPEKGVPVIVLGMILILSLYAFMTAMTLRIRLAVVAVSALLIVFSCLDHFVFLFRGNEIAPSDILSITTAGNVAAEYDFNIPATMFYALTLCVAYFVACFSLPGFKITTGRSDRIRKRIFCAAASILCAVIVWVGGLLIKPLHWLQTGSVRNGFLINFTILIRESIPRKPDNYTYTDIDNISLRFSSNQATATTNKPDIIVVMDESFSDFNVLGTELSTDIEATPFINSLRDNTLRGYTLSSVFGGGTPNSEYEFLTGNTCLFLPTGSIAYQQFIEGPRHSIVQELKNLGYTSIAMHQYHANSWMREKIWPLLGFDECMFLDDFPQKEHLRSWGTDQEMFETIVSEYEDHKEKSDTPLFMFAVTIQNHGGYTYSEPDFTPSVHLQGYSKNYPDVEQYLSCIHETDEAIQWLLGYYERIDRDVIIVFYGDHYPRLEEEFFEEVHGGEFTTLDAQMLQYTVPFFIWTNYESESDEIELISMNYLSNIVYQRAGIELPAYNKYLEEVRQTIPACNSLGYYSKDHKCFQELKEAQGIEEEALYTYNLVEWNGVFDEDNKNPIFFPS